MPCTCCIVPLPTGRLSWLRGRRLRLLLAALSRLLLLLP